MTGYGGKVDNHVFVVPAYGESPYLRMCLQSLAAQTRRSPVVVSSSTSGPGVEAAARDYGARLVVHGPNHGIGHDWNMALAAVDAEWVTLAHQDDLYLPGFAEYTLQAVAREPEAALVVTDYRELAESQVRGMTPMLVIKRMLQEFAFLGRRSVRGQAGRRLLALGCAVPCPTVTLRRGPEASAMPFREDMRVNLDWDLWWRMAEEDARFVIVRKALVLHRIHAASESMNGVRSGARASEDLMMFRRIWPERVANILARIYSLGYEAGA